MAKYLHNIYTPGAILSLESDPLGDQFLDSLLGSGALAIAAVPPQQPSAKAPEASIGGSGVMPEEDLPPEGSVWLHTASATLQDLIGRTVVVAAQTDGHGQYTLAPGEASTLRQAVRDWMAQGDGQVSPSQAMTDRVIDELLQAAQRSSAPAWATCLSNGQPLVIASTGALQVAHKSSLVREMHHRALRRLRDLSIAIDQRALSSYEEAEPT